MGRPSNATTDARVFRELELERYGIITLGYFEAPVNVAMADIQHHERVVGFLVIS